MRTVFLIPEKLEFLALLVVICQTDDQILQVFQRTAAPLLFSNRHVGVDHRHLDLVVPQKLLYRPDIVPILQRIGKETMPEQVGRREL